MYNENMFVFKFGLFKFEEHLITGKRFEIIMRFLYRGDSTHKSKGGIFYEELESLYEAYCKFPNRYRFGDCCRAFWNFWHDAN